MLETYAVSGVVDPNHITIKEEGTNRILASADYSTRLNSWCVLEWEPCEVKGHVIAVRAIHSDKFGLRVVELNPAKERREVIDFRIDSRKLSADV